MWAQLAKQRPTVTEQAANANATQEMEQMPNNSDPAPKGQIRSTELCSLHWTLQSEGVTAILGFYHTLSAPDVYTAYVLWFLAVL